jgi:broad specificity phosphatase PhoE
LIRAHRTALAVAAHHPSLSVVSSPLLREQDMGWLEGKPYYTPPFNNNEAARSNPGESMSAMNDRALEAWSWILQQTEENDETSEKYLVVVSHGVFLNTLFSVISKFYKVNYPMNIFPVNTGYCKFTFDREREVPFVLECINKASHLQTLKSQRGRIGKSKFDVNQKGIKDYLISPPQKIKPKDQEEGEYDSYLPGPLTFLMTNFTDLF